MAYPLENTPPFAVEGPCPSNTKELKHCVLRFICVSPSFGPLPTSAVGLNAALRRAYQKAGHAFSSLSIFKAGNTGNAIRSIQLDLQAKRCGSAFTLDDSSVSDDLLILDVDRQRLHNVLLAPLMVNGDGKQDAPGKPAPSPSQTSANELAARALLKASYGESSNLHGLEGKSRNRSRQRKRSSQKSTKQPPANVDDELMQLLAEPTVKRKDWELQGANPDAENGQQESTLDERTRENSRHSGPSKGNRSSNSSRSKSSGSRSSSSSSDISSVKRRGHKRRRRRRRKRHVANPEPDRLVFTPDGPTGGTTVLRPEDQPAPKKKVAEVPLFQWVSANSVSDLKTTNLHSHRGRARSRSRGRGAHEEPKTFEKPEKLSGEDWEEHRSKSGLKLVGESRIDLPWVYLVADESRRSFAGFLRNRLSVADAADYFERIRTETPWTQPDGPLGMLPRKTCWMVSKGCSCPYRYGGIEVASQEFPPWMLELQKVVMPLCGFPEAEAWPNSCNLNLYDDGGMSVGWHSDDERLFQGKFADCAIISLSLGARRKFELRLNWPEESDSRACWQVLLGDGDILTMEGMTQKHYQHRVPREDNIEAPRINLTWRWVAKHSPQCPVERHRRL